MSDYSVRPELLPALAALYEHEARMVTLSGGVGRQFTASWSKEELADEVGDEGQAAAVFDFLREEGRLVPLSGDRWRTDTCELVRLSSFNYNRFVRDQVASPTQAGVTWRVERKESPKWQHSVAEVLQMLGKEFSEGWVDGQGEHRYEEDPTLLEASEIVLNAFNALRNGEGSLSAFQYRSLRDLLRGSKSTGENTQIIEAGTGFGKSYGFQLGTLISLVHDRVLNERGHRDRVHTILLYPRVALVLDQRVGVIRLIKQINLLLEARGDVRTIEHVTDAKSMLKTTEHVRWAPHLSQRDVETSGVLKATEAIYGGGRCPDIVIGNPDSLRNRMWDPVAARALQQGLRHLVFDEVHLLESIPGANGASFLRRLIARAESLNPEHNVMITASSATVAEEKEHVGKVFGRDPMTVTVSRPEEDDEWELSGLIHHVFHRSQDGESFESNLANLTSLVTHGRRRRATPDSEITPQDLQKSIGFADSLQLLGRWNYLMRDLEGLELTPTQINGVRQGRADIASLSPSGNPQPFRFDRPLVHLAREGGISEATEAEVEQHCSKCIKGEASILPIPLDDRFGEEGWFLDQWGQSHAFAHLDWTPTSDERLGITDGCPFFQMGACWREVTPADPAPAWPEGPRAMPNPMTPLLLTSSTLGDLGDDMAKQKPDVYFLGHKADAYRIRGNASNSVSAHAHHARIALSSPVMEVGVDLDNLTEAVLFKAIRNISSYRQKIGRLGRERYMDTYAATLASFRAIDYHYYRNPSPLLDNNSLEPIPLAVDNVDLVKQRLFHAIFDMFTNSPTAARHLDTNKSGGAAVEAAKAILDTHSRTIAQELHERLGADRVLIQGAIKAWHDLLDLFLEPHPALFGERKPTLASHLRRPVDKLNLTEGGRELANHTRELIHDFGVLAGHSLELRGFSTELDALLDLVAKGWKKVTEGKKAGELWVAINKMTSTDFRPSIAVPLYLEKPTLPGTQFLMTFATGRALNYKSTVEKYPELNPYMEQGRFALFLSIRDWNMAYGASNNQDKWWYFRKVCQEMYMTMHNRPWIFPSTLFEPPLQHKVKVFVPRAKGATEDDDKEELLLPLRDVMLGFLPGMWTYRHKGRPLKSKAYQNLVEMLYHDELAVQILPNDKHQFLPTNTHLSPDDRPWGMPNISNGQEVALLTPYQIILMNSYGPSEGNRVFPLEESGVRIADGDDGPQTTSQSSEEDDEVHPVNAPECLPIQWRSLAQTGPESVQAYGQRLLDRGLKFDDDPIMATLFDSIEFDSGTQAKEFAYGHVRRLQAREAADVYLVDADRRPVAVGREFKTNAIRFHLSEGHAKLVLDEALQRLRAPEGAADRIQAVHHVLMEHAELSRFKAEHIIRSALAKPDVRASLSSMQDWATHLRSITAEGIIQYDGLWLAATNKESGLAAKAGEIATRLQSLSDEVVNRATTTWVLRTLCNSLGVALLQAARAGSGCRDDDVNYHVELPREASEQDLGRLTVWLYDTAEDGNGACETLRRWFHVPAVVREIARDRRGDLPSLPTRDFVDHLLRFLRPCVSHQAEALAFEAHRQGIAVDASRLPRRLRNDFQFARDHHGASWDELRQHGILSLREGQLLAPLLHPGDNVASERVQKATRACVTSCPQCLEEFGVSALSPLIGPLYANKRLLDSALRLAMDRHPSYRMVPATTEGMIQGHENWCEQDLNTPPIRVLRRDGTEAQYLPMRQPVQLWEEVDPATPFLEGRVNTNLWLRMDDSGWS